MLTLKEGCVVTGNKYTNAIMQAVQTVYDLNGWPVVLTSGDDDKHGVKSEHYNHRALDIRVHAIPLEQRELIASKIRALLPKFYDVVNELEIVKDNIVVKGAHYHIEADSKKEKL